MDAGEQQTTQQQPQQSQLCVGNCGFFANNNLSGFCSKCHRERMQATASTTQTTPKSEALPAASTLPEPSRPAAPATPLDSLPAVPTPSSPEACTASPSDPAAPSPSKAATRCLSCKKKVGLTGFSCRCGGLFCGQHRYAEAHSCTFDYKTAQRQKLAENNPVVQASKVQKI